MVALYAARVHEESQKPADVIRTIPNDAYDSEVCIPHNQVVLRLMVWLI